MICVQHSFKTLGLLSRKVNYKIATNEDLNIELNEYVLQIIISCNLLYLDDYYKDPDDFFEDIYSFYKYNYFLTINNFFSHEFRNKNNKYFIYCPKECCLLKL